MKVGEIIKALSELDPDIEVFVNGYEGGKSRAGVGDVEKYYLNVHGQWYYGKHDNDNYYVNMRGGDYETVQGVCIFADD